MFGRSQDAGSLDIVEQLHNLTSTNGILLCRTLLL